MFYWMIFFLILSIVTGILSFYGISDAALRHMGKTTFGLNVILFIIMFIIWHFENKQDRK